MSSLLFDPLGPLEVWRDGRCVDLGPPQRRLLLLRLLLAERRPVPFDRLHEDLWAGRPPPGAAASVHAHVSRLRAALEPAGSASRVLVRDRCGYALLADASAVTSARFETSVERTRRLLAAGRAGAARREIERAMRWWRGPALADAADAPFARAAAVRLDEARLAGHELRVAVLLADGDAAGAVTAARALIVAQPLRESAWLLLIRALYLSGRPAEALREYERIRAALAEELGTEPGPALRELHLAVLRHDTPAIGGVTAPHPRDVAGPVLVGRDDARAALDRVLVSAAGGRSSWAIVSGSAGAGKTALVERVAADASRDGWRVAFTRPVGAAGEGWRAGPLLDGPGSGDACGLLAERLGGRPTLWIVEDLQWADAAARALLAHVATGLRDVPLAVFCTVRDADRPPLAELTVLLARLGAARVTLGPLSARHVERLLRTRADRPPRHGTPPGVSLAATELHRRSGGNPFYLNELLTLPEARRWGPGAAVPPGALSVLRAELRALPAPAREILSVAAAQSGHSGRFDPGAVASAAGLPLDVVHARLGPALDAGLVHAPNGYRFAAGLIAEVLLGD
ncbi:AfsR/SARP family transcriptional regulator [Virgisporangium aliadipatigenens]|uniref:AfsR/SARP family transcriptional regulator n=1 Tax=Virgisporangium aliadipatigenens TaxID=741659 RepID=UPI0019434A7A|nr:AfsR/SARP family transcriptional regulator [Virgisporangium aliadipatigenens]